MPTYEYRCDKCGHEFEREQRITEDPLKTCPKCKAQKARRMISATSFVLKGGGWYSDLYSSGKPAKKADDAPSASASGSASESSSSTPASDAASKSADKPASKGTGASSESKAGKASKSGASA